MENGTETRGTNQRPKYLVVERERVSRDKDEEKVSRTAGRKKRNRRKIKIKHEIEEKYDLKMILNT